MNNEVKNNILKSIMESDDVWELSDEAYEFIVVLHHESTFPTTPIKRGEALLKVRELDKERYQRNIERLGWATAPNLQVNKFLRKLKMELNNG